MAYRAVHPWAGSMAAIDRIEREGSRFYRVDITSTLLYSRVEAAVSLIQTDNRTKTAEAIKLLDAAEEDDSTNPLFDYLRAVALWNTGKPDAAMNAISKGNAKGTLRLYAAEDVDPENWKWPELAMIDHTAQMICERYPSDTKKLLETLRMADAMIWSEPPEPVRILRGVGAESAVAKRLRALAVSRGNVRLQSMCDRLLKDGHLFGRAMNRKYANKGEPTVGERAWTLGRAMSRHGKEFRNAVALLGMDEQAQWAQECREEHLRRGAVEKCVQAAKGMD